jgi:hypothetical protein
MRFLILLTIFICSCSGDAPPKDVMLPEKMEEVLYDIIRTDEWVDFAVLQDSTFRKFSKRTALYDSVFRLHSINKEDYRKSIAFYQTRPDLLKEIFAGLRTKSDTAIKPVKVDTLRKPRKILKIK